MGKLILLYSGRQFRVTAYCGDDGRCEVTEVLENRQVLPESDEEAFQDLFVRHGDHGPIRNKEKCRHLEGKVWEYKTSGGGRIAWFYLQGALVVCACGTVKKKQKADPEFIRRAQAVQARCQQEFDHGKLRFDF